MKLVEIRELDGPNVFLLEPAIKIELAVEQEASGETDPEPLAHLTATVLDLHLRAGAPEPRIVAEWLETPGHLAVAFSWTHRRFATDLARLATQDACDGQTAEQAEIDELRALLADHKPEDTPSWVTDAQRRVRAVGITGTNGKTTTTRLLSHICMQSGFHTGWCSTSGVYIDGEEVMTGDYSGPAGARRVLQDPLVEIGVLENARGGILLRGLGYESNDVSVFTNVTPDHLDLQGIHTVEGLARVKATVVKVTKADGTVVLNADDPWSLAQWEIVKARVVLVSRDSMNPAIVSHLNAGGTALSVQAGELAQLTRDTVTRILPLAEIPVTYGGIAVHMVENALCATAAALALDLPVNAVQLGLRTFHNSPGQNLGRLNVFEVNGAKFIIDYAHNASGLIHLLSFGRTYLQPGGRLIAIIGTAGDRSDESIRELGRIASAGSDLVIAKGTHRYLRGRNNDNLVALYAEGAQANPNCPCELAEDELPAVERSLEIAQPGDVVVAMIQDMIPEIHALLSSKGIAVG